MGTPEQTGAAPSKVGLVPIAAAAQRLSRTPWTLKRWYRKGHLPVVIVGNRWFVPASFLIMVEISPKPGRAGVLKDIAAEWFERHSTLSAEATA